MVLRNKETHFIIIHNAVKIVTLSADKKLEIKPQFSREYL